MDGGTAFDDAVHATPAPASSGPRQRAQTLAETVAVEEQPAMPPPDTEAPGRGPPRPPGVDLLGARLSGVETIVSTVLVGLLVATGVLFFHEAPRLRELHTKTPWTDTGTGLQASETVVVGRAPDDAPPFSGASSLNLVTPAEGGAGALGLYDTSGDSVELSVHDGALLVQSRSVRGDVARTSMALTRGGNLVLGLDSDGLPSASSLRSIANRSGPGLTLAGHAGRSGVVFYDVRAGRTTGALRLSSSGDMIVQTPRPGGTLKASAWFTPTGRMAVGMPPGAAVTAALHVGGAVAASSFSETSDRRLKRDIEPLRGALAQLRDLRPVRFRWRSEAKAEGRAHLGFVAQEVREAVPEAAVAIGGDCGPGGPCLGLRPTALTAVLSAAVEELRMQVEELERGCPCKTHDPDARLLQRVADVARAPSTAPHQHLAAAMVLLSNLGAGEGARLEAFLASLAAEAGVEQLRDSADPETWEHAARVFSARAGLSARMDELRPVGRVKLTRAVETMAGGPVPAHADAGPPPAHGADRAHFLRQNSTVRTQASRMQRAADSFVSLGPHPALLYVRAALELVISRDNSRAAWEAPASLRPPGCEHVAAPGKATEAFVRALRELNGRAPTRPDVLTLMQQGAALARAAGTDPTWFPGPAAAPRDGVAWARFERTVVHLSS